jgi:hypothetical protein
MKQDSPSLVRLDRGRSNYNSTDTSSKMSWQ